MYVSGVFKYFTVTIIIILSSFVLSTPLYGMVFILATLLLQMVLIFVMLLLKLSFERYIASCNGICMPTLFGNNVYPLLLGLGNDCLPYC